MIAGHRRGLVRDRSRLRTTRTLAVRSREQGELFDHMLRSIDDERAALAHRLHDGPQQTMTAVRLMGGVIADAVRSGDDDRATEVLRRLEQLASDAADDLRRTVAGLHPVVMEQRGLVQALGSLAETVHEEYGVDARFTKPSAPWDADDDRDTAIYQIAREAAINAARHGRPPVTIRLEQEDGRLLLTVDDAGGTLPTAHGSRHRPAHDAGAGDAHRRGHHVGCAPRPLVDRAARDAGRHRLPGAVTIGLIGHTVIDTVVGADGSESQAAGRHAAVCAPSPAGGGGRLRRRHPRRRSGRRPGGARRAGVRLAPRPPRRHDAGARAVRPAVLPDRDDGARAARRARLPLAPPGAAVGGRVPAARRSRCFAAPATACAWTARGPPGDPTPGPSGCARSRREDIAGVSILKLNRAEADGRRRRPARP